jgi:hypothetical protein
MLNFSKLVPQIETVGPEVAQTDSDANVLATATVQDARANVQAFEDKLAASEQLTFWPLALPIEPFDTVVPLAPFQAPHTVVAVDGSQIMPSQHEVHNCYLINIGQTVISYGRELPVIMDSSPLLFHSVEDIYPLIDRRRVHVDESYVTFERTLTELSVLRDLALQALDRGLPVIAFVDGSLAIWALDKMSDTYQKFYLDRLSAILDSFERTRIPLIGYISHSRSSDVVNCARVWRCPYPTSNCETYCGHLHEDEFPCSDIWPSLDRNALQSVLSKFERGPVMAAGATKGLPLPDAHRRCFAYVNAGKEIARLEFPRWLAEDTTLLNEAVRVVLAQTVKGAGYPVCIAEAHNMAVVRAADRSKFFELLAKHLIEAGVQRVKVSPKESGKRRSIV